MFGLGSAAVAAATLTMVSEKMAWATMLNGSARITAVDQDGKSFVSDVGEGDLRLFPPGVPHSIQGLGPDGCRFLLVFDDGNFDEFYTFLITESLAHTLREVLAKKFSVSESTFDAVPKKELFIFQAALSGDLHAEQTEAAKGTGTVAKRFNFKASAMKPQGDARRRSEDHRFKDFSSGPDFRRYRHRQAGGPA